MDLSEHFNVKEAVTSETAKRKGITNEPNETVLVAMKRTAVGMERVRALLGNRPILIDSWYRSPALNLAVHGSTNSQHMKGEAVDFTCPTFGKPLDICREIIAYKELIRFDQLILEHTWVHISFNRDNPRGEVLSLLEHGKYAQGLTDIVGTHYG